LLLIAAAIDPVPAFATRAPEPVACSKGYIG
jgi:hypothetical protein